MLFMVIILYNSALGMMSLKLNGILDLPAHFYASVFFSIFFLILYIIYFIVAVCPYPHV